MAPKLREVFVGEPILEERVCVLSVDLVPVYSKTCLIKLGVGRNTLSSTAMDVNFLCVGLWNL